MSHKKLGAEALLDLVQEMIKTEIAPVLPPEKRYAAAMMSNALDIARREIANEAESLDFKLLDSIYEDGDGNMRQLAADIRAGTVAETGYEDLRARLKAHLVGELKVRNPRFLSQRSVKG